MPTLAAIVPSSPTVQLRTMLTISSCAQRPAMDALLQEAARHVFASLLTRIAAQRKLLLDVAIEFDRDLRQTRPATGSGGLVVLADP